MPSIGFRELKLNVGFARSILLGSTNLEIMWNGMASLVNELGGATGDGGDDVDFLDGTS